MIIFVEFNQKILAGGSLCQFLKKDLNEYFKCRTHHSTLQYSDRGEPQVTALGFCNETDVHVLAIRLE